MAQETAASMTAPRAWLVYAWVDVALHPRFATFQRWFPLMKTRWRRISLAITIVLIVLTVYAHVALDAFTVNHSAHALTLSNMNAYFTSPCGLFRAFSMDHARY